MTWCPTPTKARYPRKPAPILLDLFHEMKEIGPFVAYLCPCGWWHVKSKAKRNVKSRAKWRARGRGR